MLHHAIVKVAKFHNRSALAKFKRWFMSKPQKDLSLLIKNFGTQIRSKLQESCDPARMMYLSL